MELKINLNMRRQSGVVIFGIVSHNLIILMMTLGTLTFEVIDFLDFTAYMFASWCCFGVILYSLLMHYLVFFRIQQINQVLV